MKAVQISENGGYEVLKVCKVEKPVPGDKQVLIKVVLSSMNMIDTYHRKGVYKIEMPFIMGSDAVGVVEKVGKDVKKFKAGDRVACFASHCHAEFVAVDENRICKIHKDISFEQAVCSMVNGLTAHYLCNATYPVKKGDFVLVHACSGATGQIISQVCKLKGAVVIGTCSTSKIPIAKENGVDYIIDYTKENFEEKVKEYCKKNGKKGVNVVYDGVGKKTYQGSIKSVAPRGYCVFFGNASGVVPPINPLDLTSQGSIYLTRPSLKDYFDDIQKMADDLFEWMKSGKIKPKIHMKIGIDEIQKAHKEIEEGKTTGKIVIKM